MPAPDRTGSDPADLSAPPPRSLRIMSWLALAFVLALIFIGGLVRATGAGLGCPDWPRCWGAWWPPASAEAIDLSKINPAKIPAEYRDAPDPRIFFNWEKMWIEYLNRLWGALSGLVVLAMFLAAARHAKRHPGIFSAASAALVLMLVQGWLGALVVRSGLKQHMITLHMGLALVILAVLVTIRFLATRRPARETTAQPSRNPALPAAVAVLAVSVVQILVGTELREALDHVATTAPDLARADWIHQAGWSDHLHRGMSWLVLAATAALGYFLHQRGDGLRTIRLPAVLLVAQIGLGISLAYFGLPPVSQFLHLGLAAAFIASIFWIALHQIRPAAGPASIR